VKNFFFVFLVFFVFFVADFLILAALPDLADNSPIPCNEAT